MDDAAYNELVSSLTPYEEAGGVKTYTNTVSLACPACEEPFDDLVVCRDEFDSLELSKVMDLCVSTHDGNVLLFTHQ
ncbi:hypotheical protein [Halarchaeum acidiphilum MH1-52-1]|uniref:Hypotheical protein n=1 Tax=Halarchaeum acidiphilum MH1-52-1 TaxID=1261545 RepID=U3A1Y6_9EURY|nr:hypothetical protein [Halarchaeum acidiphilum]GAD51669.1 hypotheical protein [Halarchaeum acidiphilum MH1-52-1]